MYNPIPVSSLLTPCLHSTSGDFLLVVTTGSQFLQMGTKRQDTYR